MPQGAVRSSQAAAAQKGNPSYKKTVISETKRKEMHTVHGIARNFWTESKTCRSHFAAVTMPAKMSPSGLSSAASFANRVPEMPMAKPTSESFRAGAS